MYVRVSSIVNVYNISMACACGVYMHMLCAYTVSTFMALVYTV